MKIKETRDRIVLTWDNTSKQDIDDVIKQYYIYIRKGWWPAGTYTYQMAAGKYGNMPKRFFQNNDELHLMDFLSTELLSSNTCMEEYIQILTEWGFSPCLSTRGIGKKAFYRFHVDRARNFWADHKNAYYAMIHAIKLWMKAGRPLFEPLDTGAAPSEEKVIIKPLRLTRISAKFATALSAYFAKTLSGKCLDNKYEQHFVARSVIKFINDNLNTKAGVWK